MIVSKTSKPSISMWLQAGVLLLAILILPIGLVFGSEKQERTDTSEKSNFSIEDYYKNIGVTPEVVSQIKNQLIKNGLTKEQTQKTLRGMLRIIPSIEVPLRPKSKDSTPAEEENKSKISTRLHSYFHDEIMLSEEQIQLVMQLSKKIAHGQRIIRIYKKIGVSPATVLKLQNTLRERGQLDANQAEKAIAIILRIIPNLRTLETTREKKEGTPQRGKELKLSLRVQNYLQEKLKLNSEQIKLIKGIAQRIAYGQKIIERYKKMGIMPEKVVDIKNHLSMQGRLNRTQNGQVMNLLLRILPRLQKSDKNTELSSRVTDYLKSKGFNEKQIKLVERVAKRLVIGLKNTKR